MSFQGLWHVTGLCFYLGCPYSLGRDRIPKNYATQQQLNISLLSPQVEDMAAVVGSFHIRPIEKCPRIFEVSQL